MQTLLFLTLVVFVLVVPMLQERPSPPPPVTDDDLFQSMRQRLGEPMSTADIAYWADRYQSRCIGYWTGSSFEDYLHAPVLVEQAAHHEQQVLVFGKAARHTRVVREGVLPPVLETLTRSRN